MSPEQPEGERVVRVCPTHGYELDGLTCPKGHSLEGQKFGVVERWRLGSSRPRALGLASAEGGSRHHTAEVGLVAWDGPTAAPPQSLTALKREREAPRGPWPTATAFRDVQLQDKGKGTDVATPRVVRLVAAARYIAADGTRLYLTIKKTDPKAVGADLFRIVWRLEPKKESGKTRPPVTSGTSCTAATEEKIREAWKRELATTLAAGWQEAQGFKLKLKAIPLPPGVVGGAIPLPPGVVGGAIPLPPGVVGGGGSGASSTSNRPIRSARKAPRP